MEKSSTALKMQCAHFFVIIEKLSLKIPHKITKRDIQLFHIE